jgi:RHS repeat-associated protein
MGGASFHFDYDAVGNQTTGPSRTVAYSSLNQPVRVDDLASGASTTYAYDALGTRIAKDSPNSSTVYVSGLFEQQRGPAEGVAPIDSVFHVPGPDGVVASLVWISGGVGKKGTVKKRFFNHRDRMGSIAAISDEGAPSSHRPYRHLRFDPFGTTIEGKVRAPLVHAFTALEADAAGLIHAGARLYDPALGSFLSPDPIAMQSFVGESLNSYAYVFNAPTRFVDPSGFAPEGTPGSGPVGGGWSGGGSGGGGFGGVGGGGGARPPGYKWWSSSCGSMSECTAAWARARPSTTATADSNGWHYPTGPVTLPSNYWLLDCGTACGQVVGKAWQKGWADALPRMEAAVDAGIRDGLIQVFGGIVVKGLVRGITGAYRGVRAVTGAVTVARAAEAGVGAADAAGLTVGGGEVAVDSIRFTQTTVSPNFTKGGTINELIAKLRSGATAASDVETIRVVENEGVLWSLDNRRLLAFSQAGVKTVPVKIVSLADPAIAAEWAAKANPIGGVGRFIVVTPRAGRPAAEALLRSYGLIK